MIHYYELCDEFGTTPLWVASCCGNVEILEKLVARGANVNPQEYIKTKNPFAFHPDPRQLYQTLCLTLKLPSQPMPKLSKSCVNPLRFNTNLFRVDQNPKWIRYNSIQNHPILFHNLSRGESRRALGRCFWGFLRRASCKESQQESRKPIDFTDQLKCPLI